MRGTKKTAILTALFIAILVTSPFVVAKPAAAACCNLAGVIQAIKDMHKDVVSTLKKVIFGSDTEQGTASTGVDDLVKSTDTAQSVTYKGLIDYYEKVWWPRMVALERTSMGNMQQYQAGQQGIQTRTASAVQLNDHFLQQQRQAVQNAAEVMGRDSALCIMPSQSRSNTALHFLALDSALTSDKTAASAVTGDKSQPDYAYGPINNYETRSKTRRDKGLCYGDSWNGVGGEICKNGNDEIRNADLTISTILGSWALGRDESRRFAVAFADMVMDNLFPKALNPLSARLVRAGDNGSHAREFERIEADINSYATLMSVYQRPYHLVRAEREGRASIDSIQALEAAVDRSGLTGEAKQRLLNNGEISLAAAEYIQYKIYENDPQAIITDLARDGSYNVGNMLAISITKQMKMISLLYDIREEMKMNNMITSAMGGYQARTWHETLNTQINQYNESR